MSRIRSIKPEFPQSESIGRLSRDARLLFIMLWTIADDAGRARAASRMLASLLYPYDNDAPAVIREWLGELEREGCIRLYEVDGTHYLEIINWLKHQKIDRPSPSRLPPYREPSMSPREDSRALDADLGPRIMDHGSTAEAEEVVEGELKGPPIEGPKEEKVKSYAFESGVIRLNQKDFDKWAASFSHLDLRSELLGLTKWANSLGKEWFFAVPQALAKKNREIMIRLESEKKNPTKWVGIEGVL